MIVNMGGIRLFVRLGKAGQVLLVKKVVVDASLPPTKKMRGGLSYDRQYDVDDADNRSITT